MLDANESKLEQTCEKRQQLLISFAYHSASTFLLPFFVLSQWFEWGRVR